MKLNTYKITAYVMFIKDYPAAAALHHMLT